jgi:hypothetical protein
MAGCYFEDDFLERIDWSGVCYLDLVSLLFIYVLDESSKFEACVDNMWSLVELAVFGCEVSVYKCLMEGLIFKETILDSYLLGNGLIYILFCSS